MRLTDTKHICIWDTFNLVLLVHLHVIMSFIILMMMMIMMMMMMMMLMMMMMIMTMIMLMMMMMMIRGGGRLGGGEGGEGMLYAIVSDILLETWKPDDDNSEANTSPAAPIPSNPDGQPVPCPPPSAAGFDRYKGYDNMGGIGRGT